MDRKPRPESAEPESAEPEGALEPGAAPPPRCPFCGSTDAKVISLFGTQVMTMQCQCRTCGNYYEATKY